MEAPPAGAGIYSEDDLLPISALQHLHFCARQCALIHVEGLWAENRLTVEGSHLHQKAHDGPPETRRDVRVARGLALRSLRLGLTGKADVVEFHPPESGTDPAPDGPRVVGASWLNEGTPFPIEYKRGRPKRDDSDRVQLCAQAMCLEEMLGVAVPRGALFYGRMRRRFDVIFDGKLRELTEATALRLHELIASGRTPMAVREPKCDNCSMLNLCLPDALAPRRSAARYLERSLQRALITPATEN